MFLYIVFQYIYGLISSYNYILLNETYLHYGKKKEKKIKCYSNLNDKSKKNIYIFSGGFYLYYALYIQKTVNDFIELGMADEYNIFIVEILDHSSLSIYDDVVNCLIENLKDDIEELIFLGFSGGGVVASHIASGFKNIKNNNCKIKIITYDSTFDVVNNVRNFKNFYIYRLDVLMYYLVKDTYFNHYNYNEIKDLLVDEYKYINGVDQFVNIVKKVQKFNDKQLLYHSSFNFDQKKGTKVITINSNNDPIIFEDISLDCKKKNYNPNLNYRYIYKDTISHCTDMALSTDYIKYIKCALSF